MGELLSDDEMARWVAWKRASDAVWDHVVREITAATGLSAADFSVLTRVVDDEQPPRQQQLADSLGWQRSRLSRQLSRMAERDLVVRADSSGGQVIRATRAGRAVVARARVTHAGAVRKTLLSRTPPSTNSVFWRTVRALAEPVPSANDTPEPD